VPEARVTAEDVGLSQIGQRFTQEGLTIQSHDARPTARLVKKWTTSEDGLHWQFIIRDDVSFHDGTRLNAEIARTSLLRSLERPGVKARYPGLTDIVDIRATSDYELAIDLSSPSAFLLDDLEVPITVKGQGKDMFGTGPFRVSRESKDEVTLEPHQRYYRGTPSISRIVVRPYPTLRTAWASMMRQEIDMLWDVAHDSSEFVGAKDVAMHTYLRNYVTAVAFNSGRAKLAQAAVRRALNAAIDRDKLIDDVLGGRGLAANGPLWPYHWAYDHTLRGYTYDPSLAVATLELSGLKRKQAKSGTSPARLTFTCLVLEDYAVLERLALNIQKQLYDIGVDMQLEAVTTEEYLGRVGRGDFDAVIIDLSSGPSFSRPYVFWRWGGQKTAYNVFGYHNQSADRWFDAVRHARNDAEYRAAAGQLQRALLEDPPALFVAWQERTRAVSRRFDVPEEPGRDPALTLWQWKPREATGRETH